MPTLKLTKKLITELQSDPKHDVYYSDTEQRGLVLLVNKGGKKAYHLRVFVNGKQIKKSIAGADQISLDMARKLARQYTDELQAGRDTFHQAKKDKSKTLSAVYEQWLAWSDAHQSNTQSAAKRPNAKYNFNALQFFANMPLDKIGKSEIEEFQAMAATKGLRTATVNRYFTDLRFWACWAMEHNIIESHQLRDVAKSAPELDSTPKVHHFSDAERDALLTEAARTAQKSYYRQRSMAYIYPLTLLLLSTGLRPGSALGLIWSDINLDAKSIRLRAANVKTRQDALIYISDDIVSMLKDWKPQTTGKPDDPLFPGDGSKLKSVKQQYKRLMARAGLDPKYSVYSLRHDFASELLKAGANITDVQFALVHTTPRITTKYAHPSAERMKTVANLLSTQQKKEN